jgi:hypothetical protein
MWFVLIESDLQDLQDVVGVDVLVKLIIDLHHRTLAAITKAMVALQNHVPLQFMLFEIMLNHLQGLVVPATETGASHADLNDNLFFHLSEDTK